MRLLLFIVLLLTITGSVHAQTEVCGVRTYFHDLNAKSSSSWSLVGEFSLSFGDGDSITKSFRDPESELNISVGVEHVNKGLRRIRLALAFIGKPEGVFDETDNSEAETVYDKNWRWLAVRKNTKVETRIYTFQLSCERKNKRNGR